MFHHIHTLHHLFLNQHVDAKNIFFNAKNSTISRQLNGTPYMVHKRFLEVTTLWTCEMASKLA
jgi:hypothetical protein